MLPEQAICGGSGNIAWLGNQPGRFRPRGAVYRRTDLPKNFKILLLQGQHSLDPASDISVFSLPFNRGICSKFEQRPPLPTYDPYDSPCKTYVAATLLTQCLAPSWYKHTDPWYMLQLASGWKRPVSTIACSSVQGHGRRSLTKDGSFLSSSAHLSQFLSDQTSGLSWYSWLRR